VTEKLLAGDKETIVFIPATEIGGIPQLIGDTLVPINAPTVAVINKWLNNVSTSALANGGNISTAVKDDAKLEQIASDTDKDRTVTSVGQSETPTFYHFDAQLHGFRDASLTATGVFNLFRDLTFAPDVPYIIAHRIGYVHNAVAAVGQDWSFYYGWTDNPIPGYADGGNQTVDQTIVAKNLINVRYTLAA
jgi:hypothetical protein